MLKQQQSFPVSSKFLLQKVLKLKTPRAINFLLPKSLNRTHLCLQHPLSLSLSLKYTHHTVSHHRLSHTVSQAQTVSDNCAYSDTYHFSHRYTNSNSYTHKPYTRPIATHIPDHWVHLYQTYRCNYTKPIGTPIQDLWVHLYQTYRYTYTRPMGTHISGL